MTITLLIGQRKVEVNNLTLRNSKLVREAVVDLGQTDIDIDVPLEYSSVINIYLDFISKISYDEEEKVVYPDNLPVITDIDTLLLCFFMESFFADDTFFLYLMYQAYGIWSEFYPDVKLLPDERSIYLYTPYEFVPQEYMDKESFFKEWLDINANKDVTLDKTEVYHTEVTYHSNGKVRDLKTYHTINGEKRGLFHERAWYTTGQPRYQNNYKDDKKNGLLKGWYENGQPWYRFNYKDNETVGLQEAWYANGKLKSLRYVADEGDSLSEGWYENGQYQFLDIYKDGKPDGVWEGWYEYPEGKLKYQKIYKMGKLTSEVYF